MLVAAQIAVAARFIPDALGHVGPHAGATDLFDQQTAGCQSLIAQGFSGQSKPGAAGQQSVLGIALDQFGSDLRRLPVRAAHDDQLLDRLHIPRFSRLASDSR